MTLRAHDVQLRPGQHPAGKDETLDERLTSALSERRLRESGVRGRKLKERVDQGAAVALLETYLEVARARRSGP